MSIRQLKITNSITPRDSISLTRYLQEIGKLKTITPDAEAALCQRIRNGDQAAIDQLVKANLRFVVSVAKQYNGHGLSLSDLVNEGNIGLLQAARKFDETRGFRFISFAVWWIRQEIVKAIAQQSKTIRVPVNKTLLRSKIRKATNQLEQVLERAPSTGELSDYLHCPEEDICDTLKTGERVISLDEPIGDDEESGCIADTIPHTDSDETDAGVDKRESLRTEIQRHLGLLNERQQQTIRYFFGIGEACSLSLDEIAERFDLTTERVRQIRDKAIQILRTSGNYRLLKSYL